VTSHPASRLLATPSLPFLHTRSDPSPLTSPASPSLTDGPTTLNHLGTDVSVPITASYNHHYNLNIAGKNSRFKKVMLTGPDDPHAALLKAQGHGMLSYDEPHYIVEKLNESASGYVVPRCGRVSLVRVRTVWWEVCCWVCAPDVVSSVDPPPPSYHRRPNSRESATSTTYASGEEFVDQSVSQQQRQRGMGVWEG
jgi:hypothetical protein